MTLAPFWIQTFTGLAFDLRRPLPSMVCKEDIAHALANQCRYIGHAAWHYSIAQHSVLVAEIVCATDPASAFKALLHDSGEAYVGDWSSPLKALLRERAPEALALEQEVERTIGCKYGVDLVSRDLLIKHADLVALVTEKRDLFGPAPQDGWGDATGFELPAPLDTRIERWSPTQAERRFLDAFERFGGKS